MIYDKIRNKKKFEEYTHPYELEEAAKKLSIRPTKFLNFNKIAFLQPEGEKKSVYTSSRCSSESSVSSGEFLSPATNPKFKLDTMLNKIKKQYTINKIVQKK